MRLVLYRRSTALIMFGAFLLSFLGYVPRTAAQANSSVTGVVTDASDAVVVDATVTLKNSEIAFSSTTKTNDVGVYEFLNVPPGDKFSLTFAKDGFHSVTIENLSLAVGTKETRNAKLEIGSTTQVVEVTAQGETTINTTDASVGTVVDGERVQDLPSLFVNNAALYLELAPGVGQGGDVTGTRSDQTNFTLDGLDVNDQRTGQQFTTVINTPLDSVQELRATVTGDDATYGRSAGGQVELVTKSGTNSFHGEAYDLNRVTVFA